VNLSSLADTAVLNGKTGSVTSSNYAISFSNVETASMTGNSLDRATFNDPNVTSRFTFLPTHAIMDSAAAGFIDTVIGFGGYTGNGQGNNDSLSLYGNTSGQTLTASPAQVSMSVGTLSLVGNNMRNYYSYGQGGTDSATYNGTTAAEVLTSTPAYSVLFSTETLQYFVGFRNLTANSGGGVDSVKMYDSAGNDTFTSSTTTARFFGTTFDYRANGYTRMYAYQTRGNDTATLTGTAGNDRVSGTTAFVILSKSPFIQQVFNFSTVIVNAGTGTDTATLDDSPGNDTLNATGSLAELIYSSGRKVQLNGFDTVTARGTNGGVNRRNVTGTLAYVLNFTGTWV
jgi:hypothetical protein